MTTKENADDVRRHRPRHVRHQSKSRLKTDVGLLLAGVADAKSRRKARRKLISETKQDLSRTSSPEPLRSIEGTPGEEQQGIRRPDISRSLMFESTPVSDVSTPDSASSITSSASAVSSIPDFQGRLEATNRKYYALRREVVEKDKKIYDATRRLSKQNRMMKELKVQLAQARNRHSSVEEKCRVKQIELEEQQRNIGVCEKKIYDLQQSGEISDGRVKENEKMITDFRRQLREGQRRERGLQRIIDEAQAAKTTLEEERKSLRLQISRMKRSAKDITGQLSSKTADLADLRSQLHAKELLLAELSSTLKEKEGQLLAHTRMISTQDAALKDTKSELRARSQELSKVRASLQETQDELVLTRAALADTSATSQLSSGELQKALASLKKSKEELQGVTDLKDSLAVRLGDMQTTAKEQQLVVQQRGTAMKKQEETIRRQEHRMNELMAEVATQRSYLREKTDSLELARRRCEDQRQLVSSTTAELEETQGELASAKNRMQESSEELLRLSQRLEEQRGSLLGRIATTEEESQRLKKELVEQKAFSDKQSQLVRVRREAFARLESECERRLEMIRSQESRLKVLQERLQANEEEMQKEDPRQLQQEAEIATLKAALAEFQLKDEARRGVVVSLREKVEELECRSHEAETALTLAKKSAAATRIVWSRARRQPRDAAAIGRRRTRSRGILREAETGGVLQTMWNAVSELLSEMVQRRAIRARFGPASIEREGRFTFMRRN